MKASIATALYLLLILLVVPSLHASEWQPPDGHEQIILWPGDAPDRLPLKGPENNAKKAKNLVAGKPWTAVANVVRPTITVFPAQGIKTGAAIIVFPGGGYQVLAIDLEGTEVCNWLTSAGINCILLKYRVPDDGRYDDRSGPYPKSSEALQDAQRAMRLVRHQAAKWNIDPNKIGVLGFSAGGHLVAAISTNYRKRLYGKVDKADVVSARPNFAVAIYPGHLSKNYKWDLSKLTPHITVTKDTPPTFLLHAQDDTVDPVEYSLLYYAALRKEKVPVEMHLYPDGGHAFGLRPTKFAITKWPALVESWLRTIAITEKPPL